jgi:hypothetical protein
MTTEDGGDDRPGWQEQIDALSARVDRNHEQAERNHERAERDHDEIGRSRVDIDRMQAEANVDRKLIAELQEDGLINRENLARIAQLEQALVTARKIGAALGIVMAARRITQDEAFEVLSTASQQANRKLRDLADDVVRTGDVSGLPEP